MLYLQRLHGGCVAYVGSVSQVSLISRCLVPYMLRPRKLMCTPSERLRLCISTTHGGLLSRWVQLCFRKSCHSYRCTVCDASARRVSTAVLQANLIQANLFNKHMLAALADLCHKQTYSKPLNKFACKNCAILEKSFLLGLRDESFCTFAPLSTAPLPMARSRDIYVLPLYGFWCMQAIGSRAFAI